MNIPYVMKKCNKCGRWLVASTVNFHREKAGKYGIRATCKECKNSQNKQYNKCGILCWRYRKTTYGVNRKQKNKTRCNSG